MSDLLGGIPFARFFAAGDIGPTHTARLYRFDGAVRRMSRCPCTGTAAHLMVNAAQPEPHAEPSSRRTLTFCDSDNVFEGVALSAGDRSEDFDDVGGFFDDGFGALSGDEFVDFFTQLDVQRGSVLARAQRHHMRCASGGPNNVGHSVPHKIAHVVPSDRNNAVVQFYPTGPTSRVRRKR
ncbi:hypothetical protein [Mycobacterium celatum]|uniref:hypothetical protein n=1 Tax=Mycobacterium celatum TaxID=28045 RepID=UPI0012EDBE13|nr:hypothetical protein [Mycobacterium celatum]